MLACTRRSESSLFWTITTGTRKRMLSLNVWNPSGLGSNAFDAAGYEDVIARLHDVFHGLSEL